MESTKPEFFYKYTNFQGAYSILSKRALKWTCPLYFNDIFDIDHDLGFSFTSTQLREEQKKMLINIALSKPNNVLTAEDLEGEELEDILDESIITHERLLKQLQDAWRKDVLTLRVLCLSEVGDNLLMWAMYADKHMGAVFKFRCIDHEIAHFKDAMKVSYKNELPVIATLEEWSRYLYEKKGIENKSIFEKLVTTKYTDWRFESEWRCVGQEFKSTPKWNQNDLYDLLPEELDSVYFGYKIDPEHTKELINLIKNNFTKVKLYQSKKNSSEYSLKFELL